MKKSLTFLMLMLCCIGIVFAKPVDSELAKKVALNFLKSTEKVAAADLTVEDFTDITATTPFHEFYIFSIKNRIGFILVSGDDCALPILGYSMESPFVSEEMPASIKQWFLNYEQQIAYIRTEGLPAGEEISSEWAHLMNGSPQYELNGDNESEYPVVRGPLIRTKWNQNMYYNNLCPTDTSATTGNNHVWAGCVATAMGQVMKYWNWPSTGQSSHSYTDSPYGTLSANFGSTTYAWSNMPNSLTSSSSTTAVNAVAQLLYHAGVAVNMDYGPNSSSAGDISGGNSSLICPENALKNYFRYNSTLTGVRASDYTSTAWINLMKTELNNFRPILYRGQGSGGHMFVCDGYNSNNQFHFNWGWSGSNDGYFAIGSLNPGSHNFCEQNRAIIGIRPNSGTYYNISVNQQPTDGGTIMGEGAYANGSTCTLTATASSGHQFVCWTEGDNIVSSNATYSFTVSSNRSLYAVFATCTEIPNYNYQITPAATWFSHTSSTSEASCYKKIYRLPVMSGVTYTFKTGCSNGATADFDTKLLLYDSSGSLITSNDDDSECGSSLSRIVYTATYSGNAYLVVTGWNNHYGNYSLAYKKDCTGSNTDYNYTITPSLTSWNTHSGTTVNTCDGRIYRISVSPDYTYTFKTGCDDGATASFDTRLYLYNSSGDQVGSNDDDSECGSGLSRLTYHPTVSGYIYLRVTGFAGATGTYTLAYKKECIDVPNYHYTLTPGTSWATTSGSNTGDCHRKIYRFSATANQPYVFKTGCGNNATADFDTYLEIFDAEGNRLAYNDDNGCGNGQSKLDYTPTTSGYQYLVVKGYNDYTGSYTLAYRKLVARTITLAANPMAGGTVSISNTGTIYQGDQCTVTATPASGYAFVNWTVGGSAVSTSASYTFTVSTNITLTANFVRRYTITASANPTSGGTVTGGGTFNSGASCTLTATPAAGYVFTNWTSGSTVVSTNTTYTFTVSSNRSLKANFAPAVTCNIELADLPYIENFDSYTTSTTAKTGVEPDCWTLAHQYVTMTDEYKPMIYYASANAHSGNYSLILNKRGIYAMPEFNGNVNTLQLSMYLNQPQTKYQLQVGVMSNLSNASSFVPVTTINNSSTGIEAVTVDFSSYTGSGHYIAFRNVLASGQTGDYSCNYIDDLVLSLRGPDCNAITPADLPYTDNFDSYTTSHTAKTGVQPDCWTLAKQDVTITDEYKPMIYYASANAHSGNYSLILNKRGIYAMPEFNGDVNTLQLSMYLKQPQTKYQLQVGVMSNLSNASSFVPVTTINNSSTEIEAVIVDFSSYTGSGHYIAFRNVLATGQTGDYSLNYIDDLILSLNTPTCTAITAADLPYSDNFDSYTSSTTAKTGVQPPCWTLAKQDVSMTDEYKPMVYYASANAHSGNYSLILNKRGIYAMPVFNGDVSTLQLSMYLKQSQTKYQLQVGVMSNLSNASTFVPVATINNSSTGIEAVTVDFSSYTGSGHYIAFRNVLASGQTGDYSLNYIDDLVLSLLPATTCTPIQVADLPYTDNFDSYTTSHTAKTGVQPDCWTLAKQDVTMTDEYKPMIYYASANAHSGNYSLILNKRGIYAMPEFEGNVNTLTLSIYLKQPQTKYQLQVGVMTSLSNPSSFTPVTTINNSGTDYVHRTIDFSSYTGSGHYIAFRNILASGQTGDYSLNYIDDLTLSVNTPSCTLHVADLPYTDNYDSYTTSTTAKTGVEPPCWTLAHQDVTMTDEYRPMVYYGSATAHSGNYSLILNKRGIYAMPYFDGTVKNLQLSMYLKQTQTKYQLQVGVMTSLSNASSFVTVATFNNSGTGYVHRTVDFSSYTGSGHYIAFRNVLASGQTGDYSCNYIDDLRLETRCSIYPDELPFTDNFDSYTSSTTAKTGVQPDCWTLAHQDVTMTDEYKPMVYYGSSTAYSGNYSLILNKRGIYAMPRFTGNVNSLQLSFYLKQTQTKYQLQVGVMTDINNASTFTPVATFNNTSTTSFVLRTVNFSSYTGSGHYIAFRNILASGQTGDYSCNYIDNINLRTASKGDMTDDSYGMEATAHTLTLYPNPTTGILNVEADEEVVRVDVFDYTGRCVASFERQTTVDLGRLATGLYTLRVTLPERIEVRRVVKQ